jgi:hypothetical protein
MKTTLAALVLSALVAAPAAGRETKDLSGTWRFAMGPGVRSTGDPLPAIQFSDTIELPGTTETRSKGQENTRRESGRLTRVRPYDGPAWYEREVTVPEEWRGRHITLFLERTKFTALWVDGKPLGDQDSLACPHIYDLSAVLPPGTHRLTVLVDNSKRPPVGDPHQLTDQTQTNWNGIIGRIELQAVSPVWIEDVQVYPEQDGKRIRVRVTVGNSTGEGGKWRLHLWVQDLPVRHRETKLDHTLEADVPGRQAMFQGDFSMPLPGRWEDWQLPRVFNCHVILAGQKGSGPDGRPIEEPIDLATMHFGVRRFASQDGHFTINGRPAFLRGKHDACVFSMTGHPPMDVESWKHHFKTCQDYGINHIRFHTWCPPEAAFQAADELGVYLQPELPNWKPFDGKSAHDRYLREEAERILKTYGNHPSFVMLSLGNEMGGSTEAMADLVKHLRELDPRHLYAQGSNNFFWKPTLAQGDDYWTTVRTFAEKGVVKSVRGSFADADAPRGHVQVPPFSTMNDYSKAIAGVPIPVIGHEVGQYTVYPDFREIPKYTGVVRARNLEIFREKLQAKGMLDQADAFFRASGALAVLCYREDIEAALRTPGFGGFQLLDIQDFPGQGTALVGILNAFMESKELITPAKWREFCSDTVLLARFPKYTWTTEETFVAEAQLANYANFHGEIAPDWSIAAEDGKPIASGVLPAVDLSRTGVNSLGSIRVPLAKIEAPARLTLELRLKGINNTVVNHYTIWVYPPKPQAAPPPGVTLCRTLDKAALDLLAKGGRVVLIPEHGKIKQTVGGGFATDFWCWPMFHNKPGTMGLLCDPKHPALASFPTEFHSNWQWGEIACFAEPMILDATPAQYRPIVQVIDNLDRCHKLGLVLETRVGPGRLLVVACDLMKLQEKPEARQLLASLLAYAASDKFQPTQEISLDVLALKP